jgi:hypothetical protein
MVGLALLIVLPTIFFTTFAASFLFLWGLGGYYILKYFGEPGTAPSGQAIGDRLNAMTGGRLDFFMKGAREAEKPDDHLHGGPKYHGEIGTKDEKEGLMNGGGDNHPSKGATQQAKGGTKKADEAKNKASDGVSTGNGAVSGATELG